MSLTLAFLSPSCILFPVPCSWTRKSVQSGGLPTKSPAGLHTESSSILFPEGWDAACHLAHHQAPLSEGQELGKPPGWTVGALQGGWGPSFWIVGFRPTPLARIRCCCTVHHTPYLSCCRGRKALPCPSTFCSSGLEGWPHGIVGNPPAHWC